MNTLIDSQFALLQLNTSLFLNCFSDIDDDTSQRRINIETNNMVFIASHLIDARHYLLTTLGVETDYPFSELLRDAQTIDDVRAFPTVDSVCTIWRTLSNLLNERLLSSSNHEFTEEIQLEIPIADRTVEGLITFLIQHESFHIGQLAILRKYFGLGAMSYKSGKN